MRTTSLSLCFWFYLFGIFIYVTATGGPQPPKTPPPDLSSLKLRATSKRAEATSSERGSAKAEGSPSKSPMDAPPDESKSPLSKDEILRAKAESTDSLTKVTTSSSFSFTIDQLRDTRSKLKKVTPEIKATEKKSGIFTIFEFDEKPRSLVQQIHDDEKGSDDFDQDWSFHEEEQIVQP